MKFISKGGGAEVEAPKKDKRRGADLYDPYLLSSLVTESGGLGERGLKQMISSALVSTSKSHGLRALTSKSTHAGAQASTWRPKHSPHSTAHSQVVTPGPLDLLRSRPGFSES